MGDLKSPFDNAVLSDISPAGDGIPSRGGDPLVDMGGASGLHPMWTDAPVPTPGGSETPNSLSGMPTQPARMSPSPAAPPMPPSLDQRSPTTITEK